MNETIAVYSNQDLTTLARNNDDTEVIDEPNAELTGSNQYSISRDEFKKAYAEWDRDAHPLLTLHDHLSHVDIFVGKPSAERIKKAVDEGKESAQLF